MSIEERITLGKQIVGRHVDVYHIDGIRDYTSVAITAVNIISEHIYFQGSFANEAVWQPGHEMDDPTTWMMLVPRDQVKYGVFINNNRPIIVIR